MTRDKSKLYLRPEFDFGVVYAKYLPDKVIFRKANGKVVFIDNPFKPRELTRVINAINAPRHLFKPIDLNYIAKEARILDPVKVKRLIAFILMLKNGGLLKIIDKPHINKIESKFAKDRTPDYKKLPNPLKSSRVLLIGAGGITRKLKDTILSRGGGRVNITRFKLGNNPAKRKKEMLKNLISASDLVLCCNDPPDIEKSILINKFCLGLKKIFINSEVTAGEAMIGPVVVPYETPCYRCFHMRLEESEFKKYEYILKRKTVVAPFQKKDLSSRVANAISRISLAILKDSGKEKYLNKVYAINVYSNNVFPEALVRKNDCPDCDSVKPQRSINYNKFDIPKGTVIALDESRRARYNENGLRIISAQETLNKINNLSGRFGIINGYIKEAGGRIKILAADPMGSNIRRHSRGKGLTYTQKKVSAAMEAVERYCSKMHHAEKLITASYNEVKSVAKDPRIFHLPGNFPVKFHEDLTIDWNWGYSLVRKMPVLVPSNFVYCCYFPTPKAKPLNFFWDSNGLGAGNCMEEAILHAILELIERDAHFILYQNRLVMPDINARTSRNKLVHEMLDKFDSQGIEYHVKSFTTDINIPTIATALTMKIGNENAFSYAVGTHLDPEIALLRSLTESFQCYFHIKRDDLWLETSSIEHLYKSSASVLRMQDFENRSVESLKENIDICIDELSKYPTDVIVVNLSRRYVDFPVVRVLIDVLQPFYVPLYPRYSKRIFEIPRLLGYKEADSKEGELSKGVLLGMAEDMVKDFKLESLP